MVIIVGIEYTIRVWDISLAEHVCEFKRMFSRDGSILASGNDSYIAVIQ